MRGSIDRRELRCVGKASNREKTFSDPASEKGPCISPHSQWERLNADSRLCAPPAYQAVTGRIRELICNPFNLLARDSQHVHRRHYHHRRSRMLQSRQDPTEWSLARDGINPLLIEAPPRRRVFHPRRGNQPFWPRPIHSLEEIFKNRFAVDFQQPFWLTHARSAAAGEDRKPDLRYGDAALFHNPTISQFSNPAMAREAAVNLPTISGRMSSANPTVISPPMETARPLIVLDQVEKTYGRGEGAVAALHTLSLRIPAGRAVALLGRSGSGKSTLLNLLGAVDRPTSGSITIDGENLAKLSQADLALFRRRRLGYVFQSFHLLPSLTVFENVAVPWVLDRSLTNERRDQVMTLLKRLGVADKVRRYPDELSGGQQQRVALARAIIHRPRLLLADEPTGNLDAHTGQIILDLLMELQEEYALTVVTATHSQEAAARCSDRIVLEDGRVIAHSGAVEVLG